MESVRFAQGFGVQLCSACRLVPPEFERAVAYAEYDETLRGLIWLLKYDSVRPVAGLLGGAVAEAMLGLTSAWSESSNGETPLGEHVESANKWVVPAREMVVTAVPLFAPKERGRGFNQSEVLARAALKVVRRRAPGWALEYVAGVLERTRQTEGQFSLDVRARRRNLRGAFGVRAGRARLVAGREVLLVDDIYTTGATARECARVLRAAGATKVWVVTLARAQKAQVALWDGGSVAGLTSYAGTLECGGPASARDILGSSAGDAIGWGIQSGGLGSG